MKLDFAKDWRKLRFSASAFLLPVFFFVLAGSPNLSGDRIGLVLVSVFLFLIPASYYTALSPEGRTDDQGNVHYSYIDFLSLVMFTGAVYMGWQLNWQYVLLELVFLLAVVLLVRRLRPERALGVGWYLAYGAFGFLVYALLYIGINQYSFTELFSWPNLVQGALVVLVIYPVYGIAACTKARVARSMLLLNLALLLIGADTYFIMGANGHYAGYLLMAILLPLVMLLRVKEGHDDKSAVKLHFAGVCKLAIWVLTAGLTVFFAYYFLDTTQVLQAVRAGY